METVERIEQKFTPLASQVKGILIRLQKLSDRCERRGIGTIEWAFGESFTEEKEIYRPNNPGANPKTGMVLMQYLRQEIIVTAPTLKYNGWRFIGRMQHLQTDEGPVNIVYSVPGEAILKEYFNRSRHCDHCHIDRKRNDSFIVRHESGETKQVGSSCLGDFLGHDIKRFIGAVELIPMIRGYFDTPEVEQDGEQVYSVSQVLQIAAASVAKRGYVSRMKATEIGQQATADIVRRYLYTGPDDECLSEDDFNEASDKLANSTAEWLESIQDEEYDETNSYMNNLIVISKAGLCPERAVGICASAIVAYQRHARESSTPDASLSEWQGMVGKKIGVNGPLMLTCTMSKEYQNMYGVNNLNKLIDDKGNRYLWFGQVALEVDKTYDVIGTVKAHDTDKYANNAKVTVLTRCTIDPSPQQRKRAQKSRN